MTGDDLGLVGVRAVHFAATALVSGGTLFWFLIAKPAFASATADNASTARAYRVKLTRLTAAGLVFCVLSGMAWLMLLAVNISGQKLTDVFIDHTVWVLLTETRFGSAWIARLFTAALLAACLVYLMREPTRNVWNSLPIGCAVFLMGSLAWSGHAGGTPSPLGDLHRLSDFLHLSAAAAWLGGLLPLALLLRLADRSADVGAVARVAALRFSTLGLISVGILLATGIVNTWMFVGGLPAFIGTRYGQLLLGKIALFAILVGLAAVNRMRLTPRLPDRRALRQLTRNALAEIGLGLIIIGIVSALGVLPPAAHMDMPAHMH
jgi:putative copper resistance protein D